MAHELPSSTETHYVPGYLAAEPVTYVSPLDRALLHLFHPGVFSRLC
jgi:hypothetical protein